MIFAIDGFRFHRGPDSFRHRIRTGVRRHWAITCDWLRVPLTETDTGGDRTGDVSRQRRLIARPTDDPFRPPRGLRSVVAPPQSHPPMRSLPSIPFLLGLALVGVCSQAADPLPRWEQMDYGPFLMSSVLMPWSRTGEDPADITLKGLTVKLGLRAGPPGRSASSTARIARHRGDAGTAQPTGL